MFLIDATDIVPYGTKDGDISRWFIEVNSK